MRSRFVRTIVAIVVGGLAALACGSIANAASGKPATATTHTATTHTAAAQLQQLHNQLEAALNGADLSALGQGVAQLRPVLGKLQGAPLSRKSAEQTTTADHIAIQVQRGMQPGLPDPMAIVTDLLQTLLGTIMDLVSSLLEAAPVPVPGLPDLPDLPGVPELPVPLPLPDDADAPADSDEPADDADAPADSDEPADDADAPADSDEPADDADAPADSDEPADSDSDDSDSDDSDVEESPAAEAPDEPAPLLLP